MLKLGIFVGENNWTFFKEIYADLVVHYQTQVFKPKLYTIPVLSSRLNRWTFSRGVQKLMANSDVCFFEWASDLLAVASHMPKKSKIVTRLHSFELYDWAPKINWDTVDKIILVSHAMQKMFVELYPKHASKTEVIYNGRSLDLFYPPEEHTAPLKIGMLGHISPIKRVYEIVLMFNSLVSQGYDFRLHIAGESNDDYRYFVAIHRLVEMLGLHKQVVFDGFQKNPSVWLRDMDVFVSNSYWEGQQVALLEAMASGCYCLSHNWAGADEMLPKENLYITESDLINKIIAYYKMSVVDKKHYQILMRSTAVEKFNIEDTKLKTRRVIEGLLQ
jgi:glycosyltransferase involved in cell wall biosynthesis